MEKEILELLEKLFLESIKSNGVSTKRFRADNYRYIQQLDDLENKQYIEDRHGNYYIRLIPLLKLSKTNHNAEHILFLSDFVFRELHFFYRQKPGESIKLNEIAERADISRTDVNKALSYMVQSHIFGGYTTKFTEEEDASVTPGERILKFNSFREVVDDIEMMQQPSLGNGSAYQNLNENMNPYEGHDFINQERILKLRSLVPKKFDLTRLIVICNEINNCAKNKNYLALGMLIRSLIDHVPPVFGKRTFKELASNYSGGKSVKKTFTNLENSSRNISDGLLHQDIGKKVTVPTLNQVNFSPDIDVLIAEIIREIEEN
ncbi:MAG: hypothetical protein V4660_06125 [Pseudomonadota bacterium]